MTDVVPYIVFSGLILVVVGLYGWAVWYGRRQEADRQRWESWSCPECHKQIGGSLTVALYNRIEEVNGRPFVSEVHIICPHCNFLNTFDRAGNHRYERGYFVDPDIDHLEQVEIC
jgi:hypothetical protein